MGSFVVGCMCGVLLLVVTHSSTAKQAFSSKAIARFFSPPNQYDSIRTDLLDFIWPTAAGRIVTSVFAEYRSTHFHGGIDISTGDDTGYKVFASRDGYVAKIIVGPSGYGKMLWLRHVDGSYSTYAHLRNFSGAIDALVKNEQLRLQRYPISVECSPGDFPVKKGDVIAYTGETGTGSPHLHFEIRDENSNFVNPLLCKQFTFPDDSLPRFWRLALTPLGENSFINSSFSSHVIEFSRPLQGSISLAETLNACGSFGFAVDVRDRINESRFNSGVYSHKLYLDDVLVYSVQFNRAPSTDDYQVGLFYDFDLMSDKGGKLAKLYIDSPNRLPFYQPKKPDAGIINTSKFPEGVHTFKIISTDFAQHATQVSGVLVFSPLPELQFSATDSTLTFEFDKRKEIPQLRFFTSMFAGRSKNPSNWKEVHLPLEQSTLRISKVIAQYDVLKIQAENHLGMRSMPAFFFPHRKKRTLPDASIRIDHEIKSDFVRILLATDGTFDSPPSVTVLEEARLRRVPTVPIDYNLYVATFRPLETISGKRTVVADCNVNGRLRTVKDEFNLYPISPNKPAEIVVDNGNLRISADSGSVFKTVFLEVLKHSNGTGSLLEYALQPSYTVVNRGLTVKIRADALQPKQAMYFRRNKSNWRLESAKREGDCFIGTVDRTFGEVSTLTDVKPPFITRLSIPRRFTKFPHVISFGIHDNLSGVEYKELKLYIDDVFVVPEIDGEHRRVINRLSEPLKRGSHTLRILLKDKIGNAGEYRQTFKVR